MARTVFCYSKPLLDLHKAEERQALSRSWATTCGSTNCWQLMEMSESRVVPVKRDPEHTWHRMSLSQKSNSVFEAWTYSAGSIIHAKAGGCLEELCPRSLHGLHSLQALMPSLLRHEVEMALEKLDLIRDRTYAWEMFLDMMRSQAWNSLPKFELPLHFTDTTRAVLVDWLIQVHEIMHFQEETLYLAIHLLNCSLHLLKVTTANLQLLGMVCLFLAAKKEESLLPEMVWLARYLLELSLFEGQCVTFLPVQLAGAALCLARQVLQEPSTPEGEAAWCLASSIHVGSETILLRIMQILAGAAAKAHTQDTCTTFIKFSSPETMHVSRHPGLKNASALFGICT
ncbi:cyclin N-terminal domain-containing protein 2 isoform X3 [Entelurus aequoreus]|uniref:cyclin N-terminal domain-containing protein 2 isoform X3 n=1 Tax=Entelurus aequoreus TaxID=161455 RepID=UPI002B1D9D04|nr:cyclin N-terminal domain-containing protein 2 isoform X3 [Entelurus aequoreus]